MGIGKAIILSILSVVFCGPLGLIFWIFIWSRAKAGKGKNYATSHFRGKWNENVRFSDVPITGKDLRDEIMTQMAEELKKRNVPAKVLPAAVAKRSFFARNWMPMITIWNTEPKKHYFILGIVVNFDTLTFPTLGESKENTKYNTHKMYKDENTFWGDVKSVFYQPDEFKLQQEANWRQDVREVFDYVIGRSDS